MNRQNVIPVNTPDPSGMSHAVRTFLRRRKGSENLVHACLYLLECIEHSGFTLVSMDELAGAGIRLEENEPLVSTSGHDGVLVRQGGWLGLRRHFQQERFIANFFFGGSEPSDARVSGEETSGLESTIKELFPQREMTDEHRRAIRAMINGSHLLVSGGPGTGKTATLASLLLSILMIRPGARIGLCAPTGKAAWRMSQSLRETLSGVNTEVLSRLAEEVRIAVASLTVKRGKTVHRLLGHRPFSNSLSYGPASPMPYDVVVVDEASMLDLSLLNSLLTALEPDAQIVLLGDANQLPPVGSGAGFADLCALARRCYPHQLVELTKNYRFGDRSGIARAAQAVLKGNTSPLINSDRRGDFRFVPAGSRDERKAALKNWLDSLPENARTEHGFKILCATNHGPGSVAEVNALVQEILFREPVSNPMHTPRDGLPVMVLSNDYYRRIFNGDMGVVRWRNHQWMVHFESEMDDDKRPDWLPLSALQNWQTAYAITIHKSQGSEYPHVLTVLEDSDTTELVNSKLLYTAITRASRSFTLVSSEDIVEKVVKRQVQRDTFLRHVDLIRKKED